MIVEITNNEICDKLTKVEKVNTDRYVVEYNKETFIIDRTDPYSTIGKELFDFIDKNEHLVTDYIEDEYARYPVELRSFKNDSISIQDFLLHTQEISLSTFKSHWKKTDELIAMREKRKLLDIWYENDETEFIEKLENYKNLVEEYKVTKNMCIDLAEDKEKLIDYYTKILIPRLEELYVNKY